MNILFTLNQKILTTYSLKHVTPSSISRSIRKRRFFEMASEIVNPSRKEAKSSSVTPNLMNIKVSWNNIYMYVIVIFVSPREE